MNKIKLLGVVVVSLIFLNGCMLIGVKQISRNNINEEYISKIVKCQSTMDDVRAIFGKTINVEEKEGFTTITYKGFSGRAAFEKQKLVVVFNQNKIVTDVVLNDEREVVLTDTCQK